MFLFICRMEHWSTAHEFGDDRNGGHHLFRSPSKIGNFKRDERCKFVVEELDGGLLEVILGHKA